MANYYTKFSLVLKLSDEQAAYAVALRKRLQAVAWEDEKPETLPEQFRDEEFWGNAAWECEQQEAGADGDAGTLWIHTDNGGIDSACLFIQHLLQHFNLDGCVSFEWSSDCSKPRTDAYGGGAAWITKDEIESFSTFQWINQRIEKMGNVKVPQLAV